MSGKNRSSSSSKNTTTSNVVNSAISGDVAGLAISGSTLSNVTLTDHNAVNRAFDSFETAIRSSESQGKSALKAVTDNTDKTTAALKEFATQLTVGDVESAKWISIAIVIAVLLALVAYFVWGK